MTAGAGEALFDRDHAVAGADAVAGTGIEGAAAAPAEQVPASPEVASPAPPPGSPRVVPAWLSGQATLQWPPPAADHEAPASATAVSPGPRSAAPPLPVRPVIVPEAPPRPRIVEEPAILGLSRLTRGRFGSRLFTWFFVLVFTVITVQMVLSILYPW